MVDPSSVVVESLTETTLEILFSLMKELIR
jgi:hypothetical protein